MYFGASSVMTVESDKPLNFVTFEPTKVLVVPPNDVTDAYICARFRNQEPCNLHGLYYKNEHWRSAGYERSNLTNLDRYV